MSRAEPPDIKGFVVIVMVCVNFLYLAALLARLGNEFS